MVLYEASVVIAVNKHYESIFLYNIRKLICNQKKHQCSTISHLGVWGSVAQVDLNRKGLQCQMIDLHCAAFCFSHWGLGHFVSSAILSLCHPRPLSSHPGITGWYLVTSWQHRHRQRLRPRHKSEWASGKQFKSTQCHLCRLVLALLNRLTWDCTLTFRYFIIVFLSPLRKHTFLLNHCLCCPPCCSSCLRYNQFSVCAWEDWMWHVPMKLLHTSEWSCVCQLDCLTWQHGCFVISPFILPTLSDAPLHPNCSLHLLYRISMN